MRHALIAIVAVVAAAAVWHFTTRVVPSAPAHRGKGGGLHTTSATPGSGERPVPEATDTAPIVVEPSDMSGPAQGLTPAQSSPSPQEAGTTDGPPEGWTEYPSAGKSK